MNEMQVIFEDRAAFENQAPPRALLVGDQGRMKYLLACLMMNAFDRSKLIKVTVSLTQKNQIIITSEDSYYDIDQET